MATRQQVTFDMDLNLTLVNAQLQETEQILNRTLILVRRLSGGDENIQRTIQILQNLLLVVNALRVAYRALQAARLAAGDPIAWITTGLTVAETVVSVGVVAAGELASTEGPQ